MREELIAMSEQQEHAGATPAQTQEHQPGSEEAMWPRPDFEPLGSGKRLLDRKALITGGDSGIGRAVAVAFAAQGADIALGEGQPLACRCPPAVRISDS